MGGIRRISVRVGDPMLMRSNCGERVRFMACDLPDSCQSKMRRQEDCRNPVRRQAVSSRIK